MPGTCDEASRRVCWWLVCALAARTRGARRIQFTPPSIILLELLPHFCYRLCIPKLYYSKAPVPTSRRGFSFPPLLVFDAEALPL